MEAFCEKCVDLIITGGILRAVFRIPVSTKHTSHFPWS